MDAQATAPILRAFANMPERRRGLAGKDGRPRVSCRRHYYISSLDRRTGAQRLAGYVRGHWGAENLHWPLDVSFREDERRLSAGHGAQNFSRLCRIALNPLKRGVNAEDRHRDQATNLRME